MRLDDRLDEAQAEAEPALASGCGRRGTAAPRCAAARRRECRRRCPRPRARRDRRRRRDRDRRRGRPRGVYLTALSIRLAATCSSRTRSPDTIAAGIAVHRQRHALRFGHVAIQVDRALEDVAERQRLADERHRAALGLGDVHQRVEHDEHAVGFLDAVGERLAVALGIGRRRAAPSPPTPRSRVSGVRRSCDTLSSAPRIPDDQAFDPIEHRVEQRRQLVDRIVRLAHLDALVGAAGAHDAADGRGQPANRFERRLRDQPAARESDADDEQRHERERGPEPRQQVAARLGALADLDDARRSAAAATPSRADPGPSPPAC